MNNITKHIITNATPLLLGTIVGGMAVTFYRDYIDYKKLHIIGANNVQLMSNLLSELTGSIKELYGLSPKVIYRSEPIDQYYNRATAPHHG